MANRLAVLLQFGAKNKNRFGDSRLAIEWVKNRATYVVLQVFGGFTGIRTPFIQKIQ